MRGGRVERREQGRERRDEQEERVGERREGLRRVKGDEGWAGDIGERGGRSKEMIQGVCCSNTHCHVDTLYL